MMVSVVESHLSRSRPPRANALFTWRSVAKQCQRNHHDNTPQRVVPAFLSVSTITAADLLPFFARQSMIAAFLLSFPRLTMPLFDDWCENIEKNENKKRFWKFTEKADGRDAIRSRLGQKVRSHYDSLERIADDVEELGYEGASAILRERLPRGKKARSGDLGEILASELTEERLGFNVPVRRMRFKDGREVALRGDDFIGVGYDSKDGLWLLKGESKSRKTLDKGTITAVRKALNRDNGRCTPASLLFVADRLLDQGGEQEELGKTIRAEVAKKALPPSHIDHVLLTVSGNVPPEALVHDFSALGQERRQVVVNLRIEDHQEFIKEIYEKAAELGDD
jgi:HamA